MSFNHWFQMHPVKHYRKLPNFQLSIFQQNYPPHIVIWGGGLHFTLFYKFYIHFVSNFDFISHCISNPFLISKRKYTHSFEMDWSEKCPSSNFPKEIFWAKVGIWVISNLIFRSKWNEGGMDWERDWDGLDVNWDVCEGLGMHFAKVGKLGENVLMKVLKFLRRVGISEGRDWILRRKCSDGNSSISGEGWISRTNCKRVDFAKEILWWTFSTFWCSFNFPYQTFQFSQQTSLMRILKFLRRVEFPEQLPNFQFSEGNSLINHSSISEEGSIFPIQLFNFPNKLLSSKFNPFWWSFNFPNFSIFPNKPLSSTFSCSFKFSQTTFSCSSNFEFNL